MKSMSDQVAKILRRYEESKARRSPWVSIWRDLADYVQPLKDHIGTATTSTPDLARHSQFDNTAQEANSVCLGVHGMADPRRQAVVSTQPT